MRCDHADVRPVATGRAPPSRPMAFIWCDPNVLKFLCQSDAPILPEGRSLRRNSQLPWGRLAGSVGISGVQGRSTCKAAAVLLRVCPNIRVSATTSAARMLSDHILSLPLWTTDECCVFAACLYFLALRIDVNLMTSSSRREERDCF